MKILFFSQFYMPEAIAPAFRATENSRVWAEMGNDVTVFTGYPNYPRGKIFDGYEVKMLSSEEISQVKLLRSKLIAKPNNTTMRRLENALSYFFFGIINIIFNSKKIGKDYDVVLGTSGIIFNGVLAYMYSKLNGVPFVLEIRDITYIQMQANGRKSKCISVVIMKYIELFLCKKANKVVVVTNGYKDILSLEGINAEKIEVITNGVDVLEAHDNIEHNGFRLSYFGTVGISQNLVETFKYAKEIYKLVDNFEYLIIGDGAQRNEIEQQLIKEQTTFIRMLPGLPSDELEPFYLTTQLSIITLRKSESFKSTIPSKLFQVMGRGIAVLFIGPDGEAANIVRSNNAGIVMTDSFQEDIKTLTNFFLDPNWRENIKKMGKNGANIVKSKYSRKELAKRYLDVLLEVI